MTAEPTDEQRRQAMDVLEWSTTLTYADLNWHQQEDIDNIARALAAAVTAEREKYLQVAEQLEQFANETRDQAPAESGLLRANTVGWSGASIAAARRIREVSR